MLANLLRRVLWHINRTSFAWVIKAAVTALHPAEKHKRRGAAAQMKIPQDFRYRAQAFERDGHVIITDLADAALLAEMARIGEQKVIRADEQIAHQTVTHKSFWIRLLDEDMQQGRFGTDNAFVRFAIQPPILQFMTAVFDEVPLLIDVLLALSRETTEELTYSQLWHRDYDDPRTVKLFAYLTEVRGTEDGPFTFIPKPESDRFGFSLRSHLPDGKIFRRLDRKAVREVIAPKLTVFAVETSRCLHMGSRITSGHHRLLYSATFVAAPRVYPGTISRFRVTTPVSSEQQLVLG